MVKYKCFYCSKTISTKVLDTRFICPNCGSRIFFKPREKIVKVKAE